MSNFVGIHFRFSIFSLFSHVLINIDVNEN